MTKRDEDGFGDFRECWFCSKNCHLDDYCEGCECFICANCYDISAEDLGHKHDPNDHQTELVDF